MTNKFESGELIASKGVNEWKENHIGRCFFVVDSITKHLNGEWGDIENDCKIANNHAMRQGSGLIISYYEYEKQGIFITTDVGFNTKIETADEHQENVKNRID